MQKNKHIYQFQYTNINIFLQMEHMVFVIAHQLFCLPHFLSEQVLTNALKELQCWEKMNIYAEEGSMWSCLLPGLPNAM